MPTSQADDFIARLDTSLVVVTTATSDERAGCVVGFHTQCSIDPLRYAVWLSKANLTYRVALFASHLAIHAVGLDDITLVKLFGGTSGDHTEKFALVNWSPGPGGVPLLDQCPNRMVLEQASRVDDGSDHVCFVGTPVLADMASDFTPLRTSQVGDVDAGHDAEDRETPEQLTAADDDHDRRAAMTDDDRRRLENEAAGAGHAIDLSGRTPPEEAG